MGVKINKVTNVFRLKANSNYILMKQWFSSLKIHERQEILFYNSKYFIATIKEMIPLQQHYTHFSFIEGEMSSESNITDSVDPWEKKFRYLRFTKSH